MALTRINTASNKRLRIGSPGVKIEHSKSKKERIYSQVTEGTKELNKRIKIAEQREKDSWVLARSRQAGGAPKDAF